MSLQTTLAVFEKLGRWDDCISITHAMLDEQSLCPANRMQPLSYQAKVMARRGQDGYWPYLDEATAPCNRLEEPEWLLFVRLARIEAYWLEGRARCRKSRAGSSAQRMPRLACCCHHSAGSLVWTRRLTGAAEPIDLEPFTSQAAGNAAHAAELWDRLGYRYEAALALLDTKDETMLRESLSRLI